MTSQTTLEITESVTDVTATGDTISVAITDDVTTVQAYTLAIPFEVPGQIAAANVTVQPYNTITSSTLQSALQELADQDFRGTSAPSGSSVQEGDTWYDTDDDQLKVYRETSSGTFQWVPIIVGAAGGDSDTVDAGSY
jgi:hypothetical protein|tara:strand:- start:366 stop:779 length:414 start_codon:yes stop_codon:yes gene_type:complete